MRNKFIACLLSLTLVFNSFAPTMAFAVGVGEQDPGDQVESEPIESTGAVVEGLEDGVEVTDSSAGLYSDGSLISDGVSDGEESEVESTEEQVVYSPRAVPAIVQALLIAGAGSAISYAIEELISGTDADPQLVVLTGILNALVLDDGYSAIQYIYNYVKNLDKSLTEVYQVLKKMAPDLDELEKFLSYTSDGYTFGSAELLFYLMSNTEYEFEDQTYSLARIMYEVWKDSEFTIDGYTWTSAEALYYVMKSLEFEDSGKIYSIGESLYRIWKDSEYLIDGYTWTSAEALYYIMQNSDDEKAILEGIRSRLQYVQPTGNIMYLGSMVYWIYTNTGDIETILTNLRSGFQFTDGKGTVYNPGSLLGYIWQNLRYVSSDGTVYGLAQLQYNANTKLTDLVTAFKFTDSNGTTYYASSLLYYIWQRLGYIDNQEILYTNGSLLYSINEKLDDLLEAVTGTPSGSDPEDVVDSSSPDFWEDFVGSLDFAEVSASFEDLSATFETTFPFSFAFGLVSIVEAFSAPATTPVVDLPLPDGVGGTYVFTFDLSPFEPVAVAFRALITVIYVFGLIRLTQAFIFKGGSSE